MKKSKKMCTFTIRPDVEERLRKHCDKSALSMSAFVDFAIEEKLDRDCKKTQ